eukprot:gene4999-5361_t
MQKYFQDLKRFVETQYPNVVVQGDIYPPPTYAILIAQIASYLWLGGIAMIFAGAAIFQALGIKEPEWLLWISKNRMQTFMGLFLLNNVANSMLATGAFEVYFQGDLVFSRLQSQRFPNPQDVLQILQGLGFRPEL